jgi:hypothetical protein
MFERTWHPLPDGNGRPVTFGEKTMNDPLPLPPATIELRHEAKLDTLNRQCCDLIDEKRALQDRLAEAQCCIRDTVAIAENFSSLTHPLLQLKLRANAFLTLPDLP